VRLRRPDRGALAWAATWALLLTLAGAVHHLLHRPGPFLALAALLVLVWTAGLADAVVQARVAQARRVTPWNVCLGLAIAHALVLVNLLVPPGIALIPTVPDLIEAYPTDQNAVSGAGGLTAGVSRAGTLTLLRWPGPAGRDHLDWRAAPGRPAGVGADEAMGVFAGVVLGEQVHWLRDPAFATTQRYASDEGDAIVTEHVNEALGLTAVETVFVRPDQDLLVWRVEVSRAPPDAPVEVVWHANLAPCTRKLPYLATSDWALDHTNDFAAAYHQGDDALVHFRPNADADLPERPADVDAWVDGVDAAYGAGAVFALGLAEASSRAGVGPDEGVARPIATDRFAAGAALGVLGRRLEGTERAATLLLAAGPSVDGPDGARTLLQQARAQPYAEHRAQADAAWAAWLATARLPATDDPHVLRLAKRSLLVIRGACDRPSGAVVASVATQLPYALDWARDGAFINLALDEAGYPGLVDAHNAYYLRVQRQDGLLAGTYPMNTYEDGTPGGPIFLEIDNAALAVWTLVDHARFLDGAGRATYADRAWPAVARGAEFLTRWRDPFTHLPLPAHEDDNPAFTRGIQGSVSAILALRAAVGFARDRGATDEADRWAARQAELEQALFATFWDEDDGRFRDGSFKELDASAWALWPCAVFAPGDPRAARQGEALWAELQRTLKGEKARTGYDAKHVLALAALWGPDHPRRAELVEAYQTLVRDLPTPDTGLLGEHCRIVKGPDGQVTFTNLNDMPHVWEHALHLLATTRLFPPEDARGDGADDGAKDDR
jgi:hypothetical protein